MTKSHLLQLTGGQLLRASVASEARFLGAGGAGGAGGVGVGVGSVVLVSVVVSVVLVSGFDGRELDLRLWVIGRRSVSVSVSGFVFEMSKNQDSGSDCVLVVDFGGHMP